MLPATTRSLRIAALAALCLAAAAFAQDRRLSPTGGTGRRMALTIGNDNYPWKPLKNAVNDAKSLAALLPSVGFNQRDITLVTNANLKQMQRAGREFVESLRADDLAFVFYSGHGVEVRGENFLIPTDFPSNASELEVQDDAYSAQQFLRNLESSPAKTRIVILDACRDNPLRASRSTGGGLARMDGKGTLIVYATSAGSTADDNARGQNGLFTSHLLKALPTPGVKMRELMDDVARDVYRDSGEKQLPAIYGLLLEDFPLVASGVPALRVDPATEAWNGIKDSTNPVDFDQFAQAFPASDLAATARFNAERLRRATPAPVDVPRPHPIIPTESHSGIQDAARTKADAINERMKKDPSFRAWYTLKTQLTGDQGPRFFAESIQNSWIPVGANRGLWFQGTVLSVDKTHGAAKITLGIEDPNRADAVLVFSSRKAGQDIKVGQSLKFSGRAASFVKEPYALTFRDFYFLNFPATTTQ